MSNYRNSKRYLLNFIQTVKVTVDLWQDSAEKHLKSPEGRILTTE